MSRLTGVYRILLIIPLILYTYVLGFILSLLLAPYFIIDILIQIIAGGDGLPPNNFVVDLFNWLYGNTAFVVFGTEEWRWIP